MKGLRVWSLGFAALNEGVKVSGFRGYGGVKTQIFNHRLNQESY